MCRVLAYSGPPVILDDLLYKPDSSLIRQAYDPQLLNMLNLGGFGMLAWDSSSAHPELPWNYRSIELPVFDNNLRALARKAQASCLLAHVRGIPYSTNAGFGAHNLHPFLYEGCCWAMAHNGDLADHALIKSELMQYVPTSISRHMQGNTDSETLYALTMSILGSDAQNASVDQLLDALTSSLKIVAEARDKKGIDRSSAMNLFFTDGENMLALRYTYDFGCYDTSNPSAIHESNLHYLSLWYTTGQSYTVVENQYTMTGDPTSTEAFLLASEPLTRDTTGWIEVPEYAALIVSGTGSNRRIRIADISV
ncbi:MAG: class II glutamine amidotransferase [Acidiferrobacterales bacterium]|nr:class II glutamine amidotransferase [Acidiferrobacterales bacterium]